MARTETSWATAPPSFCELNFTATGGSGAAAIDQAGLRGDTQLQGSGGERITQDQFAIRVAVTDHHSLTFTGGSGFQSNVARNHDAIVQNCIY